MSVDFFLPVTGIAIAVYILYYMMIAIPKEQLRRYNRKLGSRYEIKQIIDELRVGTSIDQVLIWESYNGGGIARFGDELKISVVEQSREHPFRDVFRDFREIRIYGHAIDVMMQMQQHGMYASYVADLDEGVLKNLLGSEGAMWVEFFAIGPGSDQTFFFATIATSKKETPYQLNQSGKVDIAKNALRNQYKKMNQSTLKQIWKAYKL